MLEQIDKQKKKKKREVRKIFHLKLTTVNLVWTHIVSFLCIFILSTNTELAAFTKMNHSVYAVL